MILYTLNVYNFMKYCKNERKIGLYKGFIVKTAILNNDLNNHYKDIDKIISLH